MGLQHYRQLFLSLIISIPLWGCVAAGLPLELAVAGGSEAVGLGGAAAIESKASKPDQTLVAPNILLNAWQGSETGDPKVAADIKPDDGRVAQQAYASAFISAGKYTWNNPDTGHSGWIDAGAKYADPGGYTCRQIKHAYALNHAMTGRSFTFCIMGRYGKWAPVAGTGQSFTEPIS
jgi:hypothetical protein